MKNNSSLTSDIQPGHPLWGSASWRRTVFPADMPAFKDLFPVQQPLEVEVGCGRGNFLNRRAAAHPEHNFLGIETQPNRVKVSRAKTDKIRIENIRFLNTDARLFFSDYLPPASVCAVHIYFPDPWPKKRHHKRRLLNAEFFRSVDITLRPGAVIHLATDHEEYFDFIKDELKLSRLPWRIAKETVNQRICDPEFKTEFENRFESEGRPRYYLEMNR